MVRTSGETLATNCGRPFSLARYISPSNSSRTGQKSFSKASRLENIWVSPCPQDAMQVSNERLTTGPSSDTGCGNRLTRIGQRAAVIRSALQRVCLHPVRHRPADGCTGILLDEMRARHGDFGLVFPASAKFPERADQNRAGVRVDEQLWDIIRGHLVRVIGVYLQHIR